MSALVEIWEGELMKLREKVRLRKVLQASNSKEEAEEKVEEEEGKRRRGKRPPETKGVAEARAESAMSEATVNLLMDRFVPW